MKSTNSFISLDCETNGLYGKPYAVAMVVYRNGKPTEKICLSCPVEGDKDNWLIKNPHLLEVENSEKCPTYEEMLEKAADFYLFHACRNDAGVAVENNWGGLDYSTTPVLYHCGMVVEGGFFRELHANGKIGLYDAPMCPIEVAEYLRMAGEDPTSVDKYVEKHALPKAEGATHNPLFDAEQAATAYLHLIELD